MTSAWALALWAAAWAAAQSSNVGVQQGSPDPAPANFQYRYEQAQKDVSRREGEVQRWERRMESAPNDYERLKALRELDAARARLSLARQSLEELRLKMRPGDGVWERETQDLKVPSVGAAGPVDPRVHQHHWLGSPRASKGEGPAIPVPPAAVVAVPAPATVEYGRPNVPAGPREASSGRWKARAPSSGGGPIEREEAPEGTSARRPPADRPPPISLDGVDFVGRELRWGFVPFGEKPRGLPPESRQERALIRSLEEKARFGDYESALKSARRLKGLRPEDPRSHLLEARVLNHLGRFQEAREAALRARDLGMGSVELYEALAWAEAHLGLYEEAARSAGEAIRLDPASGLAYMVRAFAYERLGRRDLREKDLRRAAALGVSSSAAVSAGSAGAAGGPAGAGRPDDGFRLLRRRAGGGGFPWGLAGGLAALALAAAVILRRRAK